MADKWAKVTAFAAVYSLNLREIKAFEYCDGDYWCEQGHCCGRAKCCTYYYEIWWFWVVWVIIALLGCCCYYQQRRLREKRAQQRRLAFNPPPNGATTTTAMQTQTSEATQSHVPSDPVVYDPEKLFKLPTYEEIVVLPSDPPPYMSALAPDPAGASKYPAGSFREEASDDQDNGDLVASSPPTDQSTRCPLLEGSTPHGATVQGATPQGATAEGAVAVDRASPCPSYSSTVKELLTNTEDLSVNVGLLDNAVEVDFNEENPSTEPPPYTPPPEGSN